MSLRCLLGTEGCHYPLPPSWGTEVEEQARPLLAGMAAPTGRVNLAMPCSVASGLATIAILTPCCRNKHPYPTGTCCSSWRGCVLQWGQGGEQLSMASQHRSTEHAGFHMHFSQGDTYASIAHFATAFAQPVASRLLCLQISTESA